MVQKVSSLKAEGLSPSDCHNDPEEKEVSDDDDDDRNHKHRRRGTQSQSMERDPAEQVFIRPYRKRNKPFENGHPDRANDSQSNETWKRRPALATFARVPNRINQSLSAELGPGRGRGKEPGSWSHRDPRFNPVDIASLPQGPVPPNLFAGRGLPGVSNAQGPPWSAYGLIPGVLNGGLDPLQSLGLQGTLRPSISPSQNMGIMRQRCRDFEERGFCLRGDMCPMEHGVNRIVVEDVQSLSQFNLPVSLPSGHLLGSPAVLPSASTSSSTMMNSISLYGKSGKPGIADGGLGMDGVSSCADGADFYDPDQPLWTNDCPGTSAALRGVNPSKFDETECLDSENERHIKGNATAVGYQGTSSSVWGRIGTKTKSEMKGRFDSIVRFSHYNGNKAKQDQDTLVNVEHAALEEEKMGSQDVDTSLKTHDATEHSIRKPIQKAQRTLFVNNIPKKDNKIESLLSHFKKFGEVIDIYIPHTGDRAFVQFSRREEAEGALKAPDAVMGNRFIKLLWANRDRIPEDVPISGNSASSTPHGVAALQAPPYQSVAQKGKDNLHPAALKTSFPNASVPLVPHTDNPKPVVANLPKAPPSLQKKSGNLALLEEFRKMQEAFAQKRNALQRQLDKIEKKTAGPKGEVASEQVAKRQKVGTAADVAKAAASSSTDSGSKAASPQAEVSDQNKSVENAMNQSSSKPLATVALNESPSLKQSIRPLAPPGAPFVINRFKLDNRPTAFRVSPPLPTGLENIAVLKEHFSAYGELSSVELEDGDSSDSLAPKNCSAIICFTTRRSAERAFVGGKYWQDHTLQLVWLAPSNSSNDNGNGDKLSPASKVSVTKSGESEILVGKSSNGECMEKGEILWSSSSGISGDE